MTWADVSARLGRNDLPHALAYAVFRDMTLTESEDIAKGVTDAWTMAEWPGQHLDADLWANLFTYACEDLVDGYLHDGEVKGRDELPDTVTLWRGAIPEHAVGMSWTDDRDRAHWFAHRFDGMGGDVGHVYEVTVPRDAVLARFEERRGESEWVLDLSYLDADEIADLG